MIKVKTYKLNLLPRALELSRVRLGKGGINHFSELVGVSKSLGWRFINNINVRKTVPHKFVLYCIGCIGESYVLVRKKDIEKVNADLKGIVQFYN